MFAIDTKTPTYPLNYSDGENNFYIKRDDLIPFSWGGNKVRIAIEYFNDMVQKGYNCIISYGNSKSNLNRVISNMSKEMNIPCYIVSPFDNSEEIEETFNKQISKIMDAKIVFCRKNNVGPTIQSVMEECKNSGLKPYYINGNTLGEGNEATGTRAYVKAYEEILDYQKEKSVKFNYIFHASGTGLTQAGLICGKLLNKENTNIIGISIARDRDKGINTIKRNVIAYFQENDHKLPLNKNDINFVADYICGGYGQYNDGISHSNLSLLKTDGIPLDSTYTGKAFWATKEYLKTHSIKESNILFIHTGGTPLFFDELNNERIL